MFNLPSGIAVDSARNLYIADTGNQLVRRVEAATGTITTIAQGWQFPGSFTAFPSALAISPKGTLAIVDNNNHVVGSARPPRP
jgi:DNA-binding beta-propeller fold protein YncE